MKRRHLHSRRGKIENETEKKWGGLVKRKQRYCNVPVCSRGGAFSRRNHKYTKRESRKRRNTMCSENGVKGGGTGI